jgi:hypothetical protein
MRDFTLKVEVKMSAEGANGGIQYRSRLLHPAHGGSIADPLGKPIPANVTTMAEAVAAGITAAPAPPAARGAAQGGGPARGNAAGGANAGGGRGAGGGGAPGGAAPAAPPAPNPCVGEVGNLSAAPPAGRGNAQAPATGNPWQVSGYQFDMDSANQYTGGLYEGQGRNIITAPGNIGMLLPAAAKSCWASSPATRRPRSSRIGDLMASGSRSRSSHAEIL